MSVPYQVDIIRGNLELSEATELEKIEEAFVSLYCSLKEIIFSHVRSRNLMCNTTIIN